MLRWWDGRTMINDRLKIQIEQLRLAQLWTVLGAVVMSVALVAGVIGGLYWLLSTLELPTLRWLCVGLILVLPAAVALTWLLAIGQAKSHLGGFDRGLDAGQKALETMGRGLSATVAAQRLEAQTAKRQPAAVTYDDLLPRPGGMRIIEDSRHSGEVVEL